MLTALRSLANTWVAKALFVLLVLSFGIWGVGDMIRNLGRDAAVARVGGEEIEVDEAQQAIRREMQRLARQLGGQLDNPQLRAAVAAQAMDALVNDRVIRQEQERMRIAVPDAAVRDFVFTIPAFRGADGRFSRPFLENFLRQNDLTEGQFLTLVRADLARQQLANTIRAGAVPPDALTKPLFRWAAEQRTATLVTLPFAQAPEPAAPDEATLRRFHENNPERFSAPEYRAATVALLNAQLISQEIQISDAELAAAYEQRRAQYETAEKRVLEQALLQDEDKAKALAEAWRRGATFQQMTQQAEAAEGQALELGPLDRAGLPFPTLAEAVFALPEGGVTAPIETDLGWHVLKVVRIEPPTSRSFAEVKDELRAELTSERAADLAFERANRVEDALAGGATLEEVARRFGLGLATVNTDASGKDPEGKDVSLPVVEAARAAVFRAIFNTDRNAPLRLQEGEAGFVAVTIRAITPATLRPFESVRAEVLISWMADARRRAQEERAAAMLAAVKGGKTLAAAAQEAGLGSRQVGAIPRTTQQDSPIPQPLRAPLFETALNDATMVETPDGFTVAQVVEVTPADPDADAAAVAQLRGAVEQSIAQDLEVQYTAALRGRANIRINQRLLDQIGQP